jgi:hypothetical protein
MEDARDWRAWDNAEYVRPRARTVNCFSPFGALCLFLHPDSSSNLDEEEKPPGLHPRGRSDIPVRRESGFITVAGQTENAPATNRSESLPGPALAESRRVRAHKAAEIPGVQTNSDDGLHLVTQGTHTFGAGTLRP